MKDKPPINEGEVYVGTVESVGGKGDGVIRIKGFVVFVPGVAKGDYVKIKATKVLPKVAFGELVEKLERPKKDSYSPKPLTEPKKIDPEIEKLLTTSGDSEDFGEEE